MLPAQPQRASRLLMVRPAAFGFNAEAASSNAFATPSNEDARDAARAEFDEAVATLLANDIAVIVLDDLPDPATPDAVFPNNWVSLHGDGTMIIHSMANESRRAERVPERLVECLQNEGLTVRRRIDLTGREDKGVFLEGTGSLILDHPNRQAFANRSDRTTDAGVQAFEEATGWHVNLFDARDPKGADIYHTNVLMSLGRDIAILCIEAVAPEDRPSLLTAIKESGRTIVEISFAQMAAFAGNVLEVETRSGDPRMLMSKNAYEAFTPDQRARIERLSGPIIACAIPTIERIGGGSLRCMIAEAPLPEA